MSFILDALKKSEAERQRQAGPTLLEVRVTRPRRRYPLWAAIVGVLLVVNAVVLVVFVLHRPAAPPAGARAGDLPSAQAAATEAKAGAPDAYRASAGASLAAPTPPSAAPAATANAGLGAVTGTATNASSASGAPVGSGAASQAAVAPLAAAPGRNPADDEPALTAGSAQVEHASADNYANLPSFTQVGGSMPALRLDLLDYSDRPNERYALINMRRVREGDVLPEGPRVLAITRDGVALNYDGQDFMLRPTAQ